MLWIGLIQLGRGAEAINASRELVKVVPVDVVETVPPLEYFFPAPYWSLVRFGKYDEMLAEPAPAASLKYTTGMWRYGRGIALAAKGKTAEAKAELDSVAAITAATPKEAPAGINSQKNLLSLAERHLAGKVALAKGDTAAGDQGVRGRRFRWRTGCSTTSRRPGTIRSGRSWPGCISRWGMRRWRRSCTGRTWCTTPTTGGRCTGWPGASRRRRRAREAGKVDAQYRKIWDKADTKPLAVGM